MYSQLLERESIRVVFNLIHKEPGVRFSEIAKKTNLHDPEVAAALKALKEADFIWATTIPTKGARIFMSYELAPAGKRAAKTLGEVVGVFIRAGDADAKAAAKHLEATKI